MTLQPPQPDDIRQRIGPWLDGELSPDDAAEVERALNADPALTAEAEEMRSLTYQIAQIPQVMVAVPPWSQLEAKLDQAHLDQAHVDQAHVDTADRAPADGRSVIGWIRRHAQLVAAACIGLVLIGALSVGYFPRNTYAGTVDFGPLLSAQDSTLDAGLADFLQSVNAEPVAVPSRDELHFDPLGPMAQGRELVKAYRFFVAGKPAYCMVYQGAGPGVVIIQCPPGIQKLHGKWHCDHGYDLGTHREHMVEMGTWRLAHLERPGFCVCVFSTLQPKSELPVLVAALDIR